MSADKKIFTPLGASNHVPEERADLDAYGTDPRALEALLRHWDPRDEFINEPLIWEPACGSGALVDVLRTKGYNVTASDIVYYENEYDADGAPRRYLEIDFLNPAATETMAADIILTNPPYKQALEFVKVGLEKAPVVVMFLKTLFLETAKRRSFFDEGYLRNVYVFSDRVNCYKYFDYKKKAQSAVSYSWFIFDRRFNGYPQLDWLWLDPKKDL